MENLRPELSLFLLFGKRFGNPSLGSTTDAENISMDNIDQNLTSQNMHTNAPVEVIASSIACLANSEVGMHKRALQLEKSLYVR